MSQASATKLIPKLRFKIHERRRLSTPEVPGGPVGPVSRHGKIRKTVTALFKYERLEMNYYGADEARGYAERLLSDAIRYGDTHKPTMEMASYWIVDSGIIHKLFKVLAPRYKDTKTSYTKLWRAPNVYPGKRIPKCILELRGNIYPPLGPDTSHKKNLIHNILLEEAKNVYREEKALKEQEKKAERSIAAGRPVESASNVEENTQFNAAVVDVDTESSNIDETELKGETNLKADSSSESKIKENIEVNSTVEESLDLSKMKIAEEKQVKSPSEDDKK